MNGKIKNRDKLSSMKYIEAHPYVWVDTHYPFNENK